MENLEIKKLKDKQKENSPNVDKNSIEVDKSKESDKQKENAPNNDKDTPQNEIDTFKKNNQKL
jgi:hypothetical protein